MKAAYRRFCEEQKGISVFMQPWFLDIVAPDGWDVVLSRSKDERIQGVWPFYRKVKKGFSFIQMPPYTQLLGPKIVFPDYIETNYKRSSHYFKVLQDLEAQLPKFDYLNINFDSSEGPWFPLYSRDYKQTTRYTYVIEASKDQEFLQKQLKPQLRNTLTNKSTLGEVRRAEEGSEFLALLERTFNENQIDQFYHPNIINALISKAIERNQGTIYTFDGMPAGIFILKDQQRHYCLFTATNEEGKAQEGVAHLIWRAVLDAGKEGKAFDFEGSMLPGVEKFFRSFGGVQMPYHQITKINSPLLRLYKFLKP
jgi:hypothetical protein